MNRFRIVAAFVVILTLIGVVAFAAGLDAREELDPQAVIVPGTTTTTEPDFEALVKSGVVNATADVETALTEEAIDRSTSTTTTSTTTTTLPPATPTTGGNSQAKSSPAATSPPTTKAPSQGGYVSGAESDFASKINSFRKSNGLATLSRDSSLNSYARSWAKKLAQSGGLSHSNIGSLLPPWSAVGENVGTGGSVQGIFDALKASSGHRSNMLGNFTHFGVGVYQDSNGTLWTAHVFTR